jgi:hypothetical protein
VCRLDVVTKCGFRKQINTRPPTGTGNSGNRLGEWIPIGDIDPVCWAPERKQCRVPDVDGDLFPVNRPRILEQESSNGSTQDVSPVRAT